ncbi:MAG TPA: adenylyl-sulfate reductase subunit alpha [Thermoanaerobaculales bacterium]|nr:adenylyl-sulfate reductase subunit alpha [Thermoanaerobaculales bacterium]HPA80047.1 adenylyl-sulfate reductase subunit alpha [Thermoanaerobaculales bacterium]HQL30402.1 adenylyl-sulfate reductase subunit alpha [Thermoanaerobaculales bacterium]HQN95837.1 adenylyl-sulfate reductase subunit alpha [Thermoanaerobaculales bacterium]HQP44928.1 adenylyl-sulfate reductase subunit alpha [Thermoanaerobaculales bacterium]
MNDFETVTVETDLLILGGGMAACGAAVEAAYWGRKHGVKVTLVDKAAVDRSGAVAMGLSAINQYVGLKDGQNTVRNYVEYVRNDLMGVARDDLVANVARHVDSTVHLFEKWGLPIWKDEQGAYVHEGRWQLMINGESYKVVVAEAAKNHLGIENIYERIFIVGPIMDGEQCRGAYGFSVRENKFYVFLAKATLVAMGGAVHVFKPRSSGEGLGRAWYPPWNSGSSAYFTLKAGSEMTCQEVRFIPVRFKDAYGPVGAWFLLFKSRATNAFGGEYMVERRAELDNWKPYGHVKPIPANLRNYLGMLDVMEGKGPIYMRTEEAIQKIADKHKDDPKAYKKKMKELESEAWEDFLDMTISQAILWAACDVQPEQRSSEIAAAEPYFIGSHSGASGAWVSGPEDLAPEEYFWGYECMCTTKGVFAAGDASGASSHKFSSGSHAEGRIAAKAAIRYIVNEKPPMPTVAQGIIDDLKAKTVKPLQLFAEHKGFTSQPDVNPHYIRPKMFMFRLQKLMDEYAGGVGSQFTTSKYLLERGLELLGMLKEDSANLAAENLHELMRCWENYHRMYQAEAHIRTILFREETRWPGYYFRADFPRLDQQSWLCFVNCRMDPVTEQWEMFKRPILPLFTSDSDHELLGG